MKFRLILLLCSLLLPLASVPASAQSILSNLYRNHRYFELRDAVVKRSRGNDPELLFYRGIVANRFNRLEESTQFLERYLRTGPREHSRPAYENLADNYLRRYQYGKAADIYQLLGDRFGKAVDPSERADYENSYRLWNSLRNAPPQLVSSPENSTIQGTRDKANLLNLKVESGLESMDFVFDTGANISTMTMATARKLNLTVIETSISVGSSSDIAVKSRLAIAPELRLGGITLKNVVFLVLDDKALFFPEIDYQINGIIGFPVIEALGRLTIEKTNTVSVTKSTQRDLNAPNLALEKLRPLLDASVGGKRMIFMLDSGADGSTFYPPFFRANRARILRSAKSVKIHLGGAGGSEEVTGYDLADVEINVGGNMARFSVAEILAIPVNEESHYLYGSLGQDLIRQFASMTLDFRSMRITFK